MRSNAEVEERPEAAEAVFGDRVEVAQRYADLLAVEGLVRGLIGPRELPQLWVRHILNCAVVGEVIEPGASVTDIGSGAGLPGIPLALARPDVSVTLIEPLQRRTTFLEEAVSELGLGNVRVVRGRADEKSVRVAVAPADVVTSRAVAPLDRLAKWSAPLTMVGGRMVALEGRSAGDEIQEHEKAAYRVGLTNLRVEQCGLLRLETPTTILVGDRVERSRKERV